MDTGGDHAPTRLGRTLVLVAQQLIDARLGTRLRVHALDDHRAIEARAGLAVLHRLAGHRAGDDDRVGRDFADEDLAGFAIDDLGRGADEYAHREHRPLAHDHALDHFRARADEAVILDDDRTGLQ